MSVLHLYSIGRRAYDEVRELQRKLHTAVMHDQHSDVLILCEHNPVVTLGRSGKREHILLSRAELAARGVEFFEVERGGDATFHGPGQLVAYPIINLSHHRRDVAWYMRKLEQVVVTALRGYEIEAQTLRGRTGVWICRESTSAKIASIGVRISRWCAWHGFAVNVMTCMDDFALIHPCGFKDIEVTSMTAEGADCGVVEFGESVLQSFCEAFQYHSCKRVEHEWAA